MSPEWFVKAIDQFTVPIRLSHTHTTYGGMCMAMGRIGPQYIGAVWLKRIGTQFTTEKSV